MNERETALCERIGYEANRLGISMYIEAVGLAPDLFPPGPDDDRCKAFEAGWDRYAAEQADAERASLANQLRAAVKKGGKK